VVRPRPTRRNPLRAFVQVRVPLSTHLDPNGGAGVASGRRGRRFKPGHPHLNCVRTSQHLLSLAQPVQSHSPEMDLTSYALSSIPDLRSTVGGGVAVGSVRSPLGFWGWLSRPWWIGLGVIIATVIALVSIFLTSGGTSGYSNTGNCVAQGNNNTVNCPSSDSGVGR
jgi:hypothetical protein